MVTKTDVWLVDLMEISLADQMVVLLVEHLAVQWVE